MSRTNRQKMILSFLEEHDSVNVNELSEYFHVTPTSIRRDLVSLEEAGWIIRSRGQAQLNNKSFRSGLLNTAFNKRTSINSNEKTQKSLGMGPLFVFCRRFALCSSNDYIGDIV